MYVTIRDSVIPDYRKVVEELEKISKELVTNDVRKLNEVYIDGVNSQMSAFTAILVALEGQSYQQMTSANERLDKGRKQIREWQVQLRSMCKAHNVEFK